LGVASSYGAPAGAFEEAFERGCNYFYWGWKRDQGMRQAIRNICGGGGRDRLFLVIQSYSRSAMFLERSYGRALRLSKVDHGEVLLLGWHNRTPSRRILDRALKMKEKGLFRYLGVSGHNRLLFPELARLGIFDLFHVRYNAAHRGAEQETFPNLPQGRRPGVATYTATRWGHLLQEKRMPPGEKPPRARDCYRFVMTNPAVDVCLCGPRNVGEMREAWSALEAGPLSNEEMDRLRRIGDHVRGGGRSMFEVG
jgi:aryl-alcohol dehydrogenase-like predicted oxidoreductase